MKTTRIFKFVSRYRYFIVGVLTVSLVYGLIRAFREAAIDRELELPQVQRIGYERFVLANGLELIVHHDSSAPTVSVNMSYRVGSRDEPRGKTGLAHLTEHLMLEAGGQRTAESQSVVDELGAWDYNGSTDRDRTRLYMTVPKQALDAALWVESERMGYLADKLTEDAVIAARQDVLNELRRNQSTPDAAFEAIITEAAFPPSHPYSHLPGGKPEDVEAIALPDVKQWLKNYYKPNNATLVLAGDVDIATVRTRVETYFGPIPGGPRSHELVSHIPQQLSLRRYTTTSIPAGTLVFVWSLPGQGSPELDYLDLARHLLETRLTQRLVSEDRSASSVQIDLKPYHLCSLLVLRVEMNAQGTESNVLSSIKQELEDLTAKDFERVELDEAKQGILLSLLYTSERVGGPVGKAEILASAATLAGNAADFNLTIERVRNALPNDVRIAAGAWLPLDVATLVAHGPKADQETVPASGSSRPLTMPSAHTDQADTQLHLVPERMTIANGLTILAVKRLGPINGVKLVWPKEASLSIPKEQLTKATLNLLAEGAGARRNSGLQRDVGSLSYQLVLDDTMNYYSLGLDVPSQYLSQGLEVLSRLVVGVSFDESQVAAIRSQWQQRLKQAEPSSWKIYLSTLLRLASADKLDEARELDCGPLTSFTAADIRKTYETQFSPDDATLIVVGDIDPVALKEAATRLFGAWRGAGEHQNGASPLPRSKETPIYIFDRPGTDYAISLSGWASLDLRAGGFLSDILTTMLDSRVSRGLRKEKQISHETFAGHSDWGQSGLMYVYADSRAEQIPEALRLVAQVFRPSENRDAFCEAEFKHARVVSAKRTLQALESTRSLMDFLAAFASGTEQGSQTRPLSCDDVLSVSRRIPEHSTLIQLIAGDSNRIAQGALGQRVEVVPRLCWSSLY